MDDTIILWRKESTKAKPSTPLPDVQWRDVKGVKDGNSVFSEENEKDIRDKLEKINSESGNLKTNILMLGPMSSGKSSFINSVASICKNRIADVTHAGGAESSLTVKFTKYAPRKGLLKNFRLFDCMGLERTGRGFHVDDAVNLVKGHIPKHYKFNPASPLSDKDEKFIKNPKQKDIVNCVAYVVDAEVLCGELSAEIMEKIHELQKQLNDLKTPRVLLLTKIDKSCPEVEKNIENVYKSMKIKEIVKTAGQIFGMPENHIFPVKNYVEETNIHYQTNVPILLALETMMNFAEDGLESQADSSDDD